MADSHSVRKHTNLHEVDKLTSTISFHISDGRRTHGTNANGAPHCPAVFVYKPAHKSTPGVCLSNFRVDRGRHWQWCIRSCIKMPS